MLIIYCRYIHNNIILVYILTVVYFILKLYHILYCKYVIISETMISNLFTLGNSFIDLRFEVNIMRNVLVLDLYYDV